MMYSIRIPAIVGLLVGGVTVLGGQRAGEADLQVLLKRLFPAATAFSAKQVDPPHFKAYGRPSAGGKETLSGLAFWTTDLEPLERGYGGPIQMLVGMDINGVLTGVVMAEHHEPYGDFSIDLPQFVAQFSGKNIRDPFRVGADIDAVSRATITVSSATRAVRNSSRRIARQLLPPPVKQ